MKGTDSMTKKEQKLINRIIDLTTKLCSFINNTDLVLED